MADTGYDSLNLQGWYMPVRQMIRTVLLPLVGAMALLVSLPVSSAYASGESGYASRYRLFPWLYFVQPDAAPASLADSGDQPVYGPRNFNAPNDEIDMDGAAQAAAERTKAAERVPLLAGNQIIAFYGKPGSPRMGILGEYPKESLAPLLEGYAKLYDAANGNLGVVPAFHIVYGTVWPEGEIGLLKRSVVEEYIQFAADRGWIVFLDHQIGRYTVEYAVNALLPFLRYPNVHLAIDPEWRTLQPMKEIGFITGDELNQAQKMINDYLSGNQIPGIRMLVVHQFNPKMIQGRAAVRADFDRVVLVHNADGFGQPALKRQSYAYNALATNMPVKGFKLFFQSKVQGAGSDTPLMLPEEVIALDPMPFLVMYQ